jgi:hypothetical protein
MCTYFEENILPLFAASHMESLYRCLDYYQDVSDPFSTELLDRYDRLYPGGAKLTGGSAATGMYRGGSRAIRKLAGQACGNWRYSPPPTPLWVATVRFVWRTSTPEASSS